MDYTLAIAARELDSREFGVWLERTLQRLIPHPTRLVIYDNGRQRRVEETLRNRVLPIGSVHTVDVAGGRRRLTDQPAMGRVWRMAARQTSRFALLMSDDYRLIRTVEVPDVAFVLERLPELQAMQFAAQPVAVRSSDRRGSGTVAWSYTDGWDPAGWPALVRTDLMRSFPWPRRGGALELETGIKAALPGVGFGIWGVGTAWAALT